METLSNNAPVIIPSTVGVPARKDAVHILAISVAGALGKSSTTTDVVSESTDESHLPLFSSSVDTSPTSPEPDTTPAQPYQAIYLLNCEQTQGNYPIFIRIP